MGNQPGSSDKRQYAKEGRTARLRKGKGGGGEARGRKGDDVLSEEKRDPASADAKKNAAATDNSRRRLDAMGATPTAAASPINVPEASPEVSSESGIGSSAATDFPGPDSPGGGGGGSARGSVPGESAVWRSGGENRDRGAEGGDEETPPLEGELGKTRGKRGDRLPPPPLPPRSSSPPPKPSVVVQEGGTASGDGDPDSGGKGELGDRAPPPLPPRPLPSSSSKSSVVEESGNAAAGHGKPDGGDDADSARSGRENSGEVGEGGRRNSVASDPEDADCATASPASAEEGSDAAADEEMPVFRHQQPLEIVDTPSDIGDDQNETLPSTQSPVGKVAPGAIDTAAEVTASAEDCSESDDTVDNKAPNTADGASAGTPEASEGSNGTPADPTTASEVDAGEDHGAAIEEPVAETEALSVSGDTAEEVDAPPDGCGGSDDTVDDEPEVAEGPDAATLEASEGDNVTPADPTASEVDTGEEPRAVIEEAATESEALASDVPNAEEKLVEVGGNEPETSPGEDVTPDQASHGAGPDIELLDSADADSDPTEDSDKRTSVETVETVPDGEDEASVPAESDSPASASEAREHNSSEESPESSTIIFGSADEADVCQEGDASQEVDALSAPLEESLAPAVDSFVSAQPEGKGPGIGEAIAEASSDEVGADGTDGGVADGLCASSPGEAEGGLALGAVGRRPVEAIPAALGDGDDPLDSDESCGIGGDGDRDGALVAEESSKEKLGETDAGRGGAPSVSRGAEAPITVSEARLDVVRITVRSDFVGPSDLRNLSAVSLKLCFSCRKGRTFHVKVTAETPLHVWSPPCPIPPLGPHRGLHGPWLRRENGDGGEGFLGEERLKQQPPPPRFAQMVRGAAVEVSASSGGETAAPSPGGEDGMEVERAASSRGDSGLEPPDAEMLPDGVKSASKEAAGRARRRSVDKRTRESVREESRVATLNVSHITWDRPEQDLNGEFANELPLDLETLTFGFGFNRSVDGIKMDWPPSMKTLRFGMAFNPRPFSVPSSAGGTPKALAGSASWSTPASPPASVAAGGRGSSGGVFPVGRASSSAATAGGGRWAEFLPPTLEEVSFGTHFNQPVESVKWPPGLKRLLFGANFKQKVEGADWPETLEELTFGLYFNMPVESTKWPAALKKLVFGAGFNQPIKKCSFPDGLAEITFGTHFNQAVDAVRWPSSLERVSFGDRFNKPIATAAWPTSLAQLTFGKAFDQPLQPQESATAWPPSGLTSIVVGSKFSGDAVDAGKVGDAVVSSPRGRSVVDGKAFVVTRKASPRRAKRRGVRLGARTASGSAREGGATTGGGSKGGL